MDFDLLIEKVDVLFSKVKLGKDQAYVVMKFSTLPPELAEELRNNPEEFFKVLKLQVRKRLGLKKNIEVMFSHLPKSYQAKIEDISAHLLGKFIQVKGKIQTKTAIITKIKKAKYECPSCGNSLQVMLGEKNTKPTRCGCGRKGHFMEVSRTYEDHFELMVEEDGYLLRVIVGEPFLNPEFKPMFKKNNKLIISGYIIAIPKKLPRGSESTEVEKVLIANNVEKVR